MERDPPLGVGPGVLNQEQMYSQDPNTAVITSYLPVTTAKLEGFTCNGFSLRRFRVLARENQRHCWR